MKKDTSHEEQLRNYLEGASNVGNKGAEQPESELPDIAAICLAIDAGDDSALPILTDALEEGMATAVITLYNKDDS